MRYSPVLKDRIETLASLQRLNQRFRFVAKLGPKIGRLPAFRVPTKKESRLGAVRLGRRRTTPRPADGLQPFVISLYLGHTCRH